MIGKARDHRSKQRDFSRCFFVAEAKRRVGRRAALRGRGVEEKAVMVYGLGTMLSRQKLVGFPLRQAAKS
jgi:hypothetical protein